MLTRAEYWPTLITQTTCTTTTTAKHRYHWITVTACPPCLQQPTVFYSNYRLKLGAQYDGLKHYVGHSAVRRDLMYYGRVETATPHNRMVCSHMLGTYDFVARMGEAFTNKGEMRRIGQSHVFCSQHECFWTIQLLYEQRWGCQWVRDLFDHSSELSGIHVSHMTYRVWKEDMYAANLDWKLPLEPVRYKCICGQSCHATSAVPTAGRVCLATPGSLGCSSFYFSWESGRRVLTHEAARADNIQSLFDGDDSGQRLRLLQGDNQNRDAWLCGPNVKRLQPQCGSTCNPNLRGDWADDGLACPETCSNREWPACVSACMGACLPVHACMPV